MSTYAPLSGHTLPSTLRLLRRARPRFPFVALAGLLVGLLVGSSFLAAPARAAHPSGLRVSRSYFGLHDGSQAAYGRVPFGSLRIWDAHATWRDIEISPGHYDWTHLDSLVGDAQAHHVRVTLVLGMTPSFYQNEPSQPPADLSPFRHYVRAVMERYRDFNGWRGISAYQVWNEGNVPLFWTGTPHQLADMTRIVHQVRHRVDPHALVVAPSFAVRLRSQRRWLGDYQSQRLSGRPVWRFYDANALSLYPKATSNGLVGGPESAFALFDKVRRQFAAIGVPPRFPVWATEINYGVGDVSGGPVDAQPIPERRQVANVLRTYLLGAAHHLGAVFWYRYDWGLLPDGGTLGNTLLSDPADADRVTPAGRALGRVEHWLHGRLVGRSGHQPCARDAHGTYICVIRYSSGVRKIYWNPSRTVHLLVHGPASLQNQRGLSTTLGASSSVRVDYRPIELTWRN